MVISGTELVEFMVGFLAGDPESVRRMQDAYKGACKIWEQSEWIFIKDLEMCLKGINKVLTDSGFSSLSDVGNFILSDSDASAIKNAWVRNKIVECRCSLAELNKDINGIRKLR